MGKVGNAGSGIGDSVEEFKKAVDRHKVLGLNRQEKVEVDLLVGVHHAKSEEQPEYGARGSDRRRHRQRLHEVQGLTTARCGVQVKSLNVLPVVDPEVQGGRAKSGHEVVEQKALAAPPVLERSSEHPQREHVAEDVPEPARVVQKEVGDELKGFEQVAGGQVEPESSNHIDPHSPKDDGGKKCESVDNQQVFNNRRKKAEARGAVVHSLKESGKFVGVEQPGGGPTKVVGPGVAARKKSVHDVLDVGLPPRMGAEPLADPGAQFAIVFGVNPR